MATWPFVTAAAAAGASSVEADLPVTVGAPACHQANIGGLVVLGVLPLHDDRIGVADCGATANADEAANSIGPEGEVCVTVEQSRGGLDHLVRALVALADDGLRVAPAAQHDLVDLGRGAGGREESNMGVVRRLDAERDRLG